MKKKVLVTINGIHGDTKDDKIEVTSIGTYYEKNNSIYITYIDTTIKEEGIRTTIKIEKNKVSVLRYDYNKANLIFEKNIEHIMPYETPYGIFQIYIRTNSIDIKKDNERIEVIVNYYIEINNISIDTNAIYVTIKDI